MSSNRTFSDLSEDIISDLSQYMTGYELMRRSTVNPVWRQQLGRTTAPSNQQIWDDISLAVETGDIPTLIDIASVVDPQFLGISDMAASLTGRALDNNQREMAQFIIDKWLNSDRQDMHYPIMMAVVELGGPPEAIRRLFRYADYWDIRRLTQDLGLVPMTRIMKYALRNGIITPRTILEYLQEVISGSLSDVTIRLDIPFLLQFIPGMYRSDEITYIAQDVDEDRSDATADIRKQYVPRLLGEIEEGIREYDAQQSTQQ